MEKDANNFNAEDEGSNVQNSMNLYLIEGSHFSTSVASERSHDQEKKHSNHNADVNHLRCGRFINIVVRSWKKPNSSVN
jgi:hypothetical protein